MDFNGTNLSDQLLILIKGLAMKASWLFAYFLVRQLPMSFSGAVRASGPIWTLIGGMLVFGEFLLTPQFMAVLTSVFAYYFLSQIGKSESISALRSLPLAMMLLATILSAFVHRMTKAAKQGKHRRAICDSLLALGLAERLAINGMIAGQTIPHYTRDAWLGNLHKLRMEIITDVWLFGIDAEDAYFQYTLSGEPMVLEEVDTLVTALGHTTNTELEKALSQLGIPHQLTGGSLSPRTAEESILDGLKVGATL